MRPIVHGHVIKCCYTQGKLIIRTRRIKSEINTTSMGGYRNYWRRILTIMLNCAAFTTCLDVLAEREFLFHSELVISSEEPQDNF